MIDVGPLHYADRTCQQVKSAEHKLCDQGGHESLIHCNLPSICDIMSYLNVPPDPFCDTKEPHKMHLMSFMFNQTTIMILCVNLVEHP